MQSLSLLVGAILASTTIANELVPRVSTADPTCPGPDGQQFLDPLGFTYNVNCTNIFNSGSFLLRYPSNNLTACLISCSYYNFGNPANNCTNPTQFGESFCTYYYNPRGHTTSNIVGAGNVIATPQVKTLPYLSQNATCPTDDKFTYYDNSSIGYQVFCGLAGETTSYGTTIVSTVQVPSLAACAAACTEYNTNPNVTLYNGPGRCLMAQRNRTSGDCNLRGAFAAMLTDDSFDTVVPNSFPPVKKVSTLPSTTISSIAQTPTSSAVATSKPLCPGPEGQLYTDPLGFSYNISCTTEGHTGDVLLYFGTSSLTTCLAACSYHNLGNPEQNCTSVTLYSYYSLCGFYTSTDSVITASDSGGRGVLLISPQVETQRYLSATASCPNDNLLTYVDEYSISYQVFCGHSATPNGAALAVVQASSLAACATACTQYNIDNTGDNCYLALQAKTGSNCTLVSSYNTLDSDDNFDAAYQLRIGPIVPPTSSPGSCPSTIFQTNYTSPQGDRFKPTLVFTFNPSPSTVIQNVTENSSCACADYCSSYNREIAGTDQPECRGIEYDSGLSTDNCIIKNA